MRVFLYLFCRLNVEKHKENLQHYFSTITGDIQMNIRIGFSVVFALLIAVLIWCAIKSFRSHKKIGMSVGQLNLSLIPPMIGNLMIIVSDARNVSIAGYYIYFLGMDLIMLTLGRFAWEYCRGIFKGRSQPIIMYILPALDAVQLLLNPFFGHAFDVELIEVQNAPYYRLLPFWGQNIHSIVDYAIFISVIFFFLIAAVRTAKIYRERFSVILIALMIIGLWQTFYIFSRTPVDRSMIGYGVFGILVYYLSIHYRPLRLLDKMLSNIAAGMTEALFVYGPLGRCIWANETGLRLLNLNNNDLEEVPSRLKALFGQRKFTNKDWSDNRVVGTGDNARYYYIENHFVSEDSKHLAGSYLIIRDNTEEQLKIQRDIYNSTHDGMTKLYTKQYLFERIKKKLNDEKDTGFTAIFIDVKNFKIVNDVFGSDFGDKSLKQIADWMRKTMNDDCLFGRLAGDTFGALMPTEQFSAMKDEFEKDLNCFIVSEGNIEHRLLIHLGVYEVTDRETDVSVMFDRAHLALSTITDNYKLHIAAYDNKLREKVLWDQKITANLAEAIKTRQIRPYLQPITDRSGRVVGAEALARWIHPQQGFMSPAMFIPLLEKNGLIVEVDKHIWRCACEILSDWKKQNKDLFISVNISPKDFYYIDVVSEIIGLAEEYGLEPEKLRIEITETVMMTDAAEKFRMMDMLRQKGFIVEMDDFGSGYSSLNLLKDMPVDVLKLDMKFLSGSNSAVRAKTIVRNIIRLSEELNIVSLTEGVETLQQYDQLSAMGCMLFQGYYFAKPMPREDFESFTAQHNGK